MGSCLNDRAYRVFTRASRLLADKGLSPGLIQEISICVCAGFVTLPREVEQVLGIQVNSMAVIPRNEWFQYHIGGPGDADYTPCGYGDILSQNACTARDPDRPVKLVLRIRSALDANKKFRVGAWYENGEKAYSEDADGQMVEGFWMPTVFGSLKPPSGISAVTKIDWISKEKFVDWCELYAVDPDTNEAISLLGKYAPDEVQPQYVRIRVSAENVVRVKFRRRNFDITSEDDWVPVDNIDAFLLACRAIVKRDSEQYDAARWCEGEAERLLKETIRARRPGGIAPPQVTVTATNFGPVGLHYR
jgi:hypothetical protein